MKKWKCQICGYIHEGDIPPEICPVCGADKSKFILLDEDESVVEDYNEEENSLPAHEEKTKISSGKRTSQKIYMLTTKLHAHPISVHIPNGVLPFSVFFTFLSLLFDSSALSLAAKYNMLAVLLSMPVVLFTGYIDWKNRFNKKMTRIFMGKMISGVVLTVLSFCISTWWLLNPSIVTGTSPNKWIFLLLNALIMLPAIIAGYLGGKLVFHYQK